MKTRSSAQAAGKFAKLLRLTGCMAAVLLVSACLLNGQTSSTTPSPMPKERLRSAFQSLGWLQSPGEGPVHIRAEGTLTYYGPDGKPGASVAVTMRCIGSQQYRIDVDGPAGAHSTIVNGLGAVHIGADGKAVKLPASTAVSMQSPTFPFLQEALNPDHTQSVVEDLGVQDAPAGIEQRLRVTLPASDDFEPALRSRAAEKTLWLSADGTPARIDFFRVGADNHYARVLFSLLMSDYRRVAGYAIAFRQEEQIDGATMTVLTLQDVRIGTASGVTDADFQFPADVTGGVR